MQCRMVAALEYDLSCASAASFLSVFAHVSDTPARTLHRASYYVDFALQKSAMLQFLPSRVAAGALCLARAAESPCGDAWPWAVLEFSGITVRAARARAAPNAAIEEAYGAWLDNAHATNSVFDPLPEDVAYWCRAEADASAAMMCLAELLAADEAAHAAGAQCVAVRTKYNTHEYGQVTQAACGHSLHQACHSFGVAPEAPHLAPFLVPVDAEAVAGHGWGCAGCAKNDAWARTCGTCGAARPPPPGAPWPQRPSPTGVDADELMMGSGGGEAAVFSPVPLRL